MSLKQPEPLQLLGDRDIINAKSLKINDKTNNE